MKKNLIVLTILVGVMLAFTSCSGNNEENGTPGENYAPFIGGSEGISMKFMDGTLLDVEGAITDSGNEFDVSVELRNKGEYDINADSEGDFLRISLLGPQSHYFGLEEEDFVIDLEQDFKGSRKNVDGSTLDGDFEILSFEKLSYQEDATGNLPINFVVDLCYDYGTKASARVCVADDVTKSLSSEKDLSICKITSPIKVMNSGGPVHVTNMKQLPAGSRGTNLLFNVKRVGTGDVYLFESEDGCDYGVGSSNTNKVKVIVSLPESSRVKMSCSGFEAVDGKVEDIITVTSEPYPINCVLEGEEGKNNIYLETIDIELLYRYGEQISKEIVISDSRTN